MKKLIIPLLLLATTQAFAFSIRNSDDQFSCVVHTVDFQTDHIVPIRIETRAALCIRYLIDQDRVLQHLRNIGHRLQVHFVFRVMMCYLLRFA